MVRITVEVVGNTLYDLHSRTSCMQLAVPVMAFGAMTHVKRQEGWLTIHCQCRNFYSGQALVAEASAQGQHSVTWVPLAEASMWSNKVVGFHHEAQPKSETSTQHQDHAAISNTMQAVLLSKSRACWQVKD